MKRIGTVGLTVAAMAGLAFAFPPDRELSTSIEIAAPPSRVWAVLLDTGSYARWNPDMRLVGSLVVGATIENIEGQGDDRMIFWPTVLVVRPERELRWLGHYKVPGVLDAEHYFLLRPSAGGTEFIQGERFRGPVLWFYDVRQLLPSFAALNAGLKARAERKAGVK